MILIPEIETVVILTPRTGSGSLRRAVAEAYPREIVKATAPEAGEGEGRRCLDS